MRASYAVGLDVGGTRIAAGLVERKGRIVRESRRPTPKGGPFGVVDAIIEAIGEVSTGVHPSEIAGIGIGLPAQIDFHRQTVEFCTNLPLGGVDMRGLVMSRAKHSVTIDNDGHTAAIGESRFGAAKGARDFVMVTVGTGVGGGAFIDGQPFRGHRGLGTEIGHMVVDLDGPRAHAAGRGTWSRSSDARPSSGTAARPRPPSAARASCEARVTTPRRSRPKWWSTLPTPVTRPPPRSWAVSASSSERRSSASST